MCGIAGIIGRSGTVRQLDNLIATIRHRGPNGVGKWSNEDSCFLGHVRLSIIDLDERASQPMICKKNGHVLVFNGEIYNYNELKQELQDSYIFNTKSDTEVILAAYDRWGENMMCKFRGMFALVLYDSKTKNTLVTRDRFGIKPLYFLKNNNSFYFCSEIKALIKIDGYDKKIKQDKLVSFLLHRHLDTDHLTFFEGIEQVKPGSFIWIDSNGEIIRKNDYWTLPIPDWHSDQAINPEEFLAKLEESVKYHLVADVPVGSFLSGGLDSSSIATLAYDQYDDKKGFHTFSSMLNIPNEENRLIPIMQAHLNNSISHAPIIKSKTFFEELPNIIYHHDEPIADASMFAHWELCKIASANDIRVVLSGNGGDEILGGYASHIYSLLGSTLNHLEFGNFIKYTSLLSQNRHERKDQLLRHAIHQILPYSIKEKIKHKDYQKIALLLKFNHTPIPDFYPNHRIKDPFEANYINNIKSWTIPGFLHYEDRNSMAFGVEIRVPLLDHILVEYLSKYSPKVLIHGQSKSLLRRALKGRVPDEILNQKGKFGFAAPLHEYLLSDKETTYKNFIQYIDVADIFNIDQCKKLAKTALENPNTDDLTYFWRVFSTAIWYKTFFK